MNSHSKQFLVALALSLVVFGCKAGAGDPCKLNDDCKESLACYQNACIELEKAQASCAAAEECKKDGLCTLDPSSGYATCQATMAQECEQSTNCKEHQKGCKLNAKQGTCE
jgi:hypothetical protein